MHTFVELLVELEVHAIVSFTRAQGIPNSDTQVLQRIVGVCCSPRHIALRSAVAAEVRLWKRWTEGAVDSKRVCQQGLHSRDCGSRNLKCFALLHQLSAAIQWKSVSVDVPPPGVEPPYRPTECRARPYSEDGPVNWLGSVLTSRVTGIVRREGYPCASMAK